MKKVYVVVDHGCPVMAFEDERDVNEYLETLKQNKSMESDLTVASVVLIKSSAPVMREVKMGEIYKHLEEG